MECQIYDWGRESPFLSFHFVRRFLHLGRRPGERDPPKRKVQRRTFDQTGFTGKNPDYRRITQTLASSSSVPRSRSHRRPLPRARQEGLCPENASFVMVMGLTAWAAGRQETPRFELLFPKGRRRRFCRACY